MSYLVDTNVLSESRRPKPEEKVLRWLSEVDDEKVFLSVLTLGEIKKGTAKLDLIPKRIELEEWIVDLRTKFAGRILPLTESTSLVWGRMIADFERKGIVRPVFDSLLEATALEHDLVLVTRNVKNFQGTNVSILNPWEG